MAAQPLVSFSRNISQLDKEWLVETSVWAKPQLVCSRQLTIEIEMKDPQW